MAANGQLAGGSKSGSKKQQQHQQLDNVSFLLKRSIAFALLLLLVPLNPPPFTSTNLWTERSMPPLLFRLGLPFNNNGQQQQQQQQQQLQAGSSGSGSGSSDQGGDRSGGSVGGGGRKSALLVSAIYLEEVGRFSQVMSNFVDNLLDKVGFLAEIVIESSMDEQCSFSHKSSGGSCSGGEQNNTTTQTRWMANASAALAAAAIESEAAVQDPQLLSQWIQIAGQQQQQQQQQQTTSGRGDGGARGKNGGGKVCRFLGLPMQNNDLPVSGMADCCGQFELCYSSCGQEKLHCDQEFRNCLRLICKQKFDPKNGTILLEETRRLRKQQQNELPESLDDQLDDDEERSDNNNNNSGEDDDKDNSGEDEQPNASDVKSLKDKFKACRLASKVLIIGNLAFGCRNYKQHQWQACCSYSYSGSSSSSGGSPPVAATAAAAAAN